MSDTPGPPATWQRGYDLEGLRRYGRLFAERHGPHVFGAFGLTRERDIAEALAGGTLRAVVDGTGEPVACALFHPLRHDSATVDFADRQVRCRAGTVVVSALACRTLEAGRAVLADIHEHVAGFGPLWVEVFEEDALAREAVLRSGLRYLTTKILASSEIKGVYTSGPPSLPTLPPEEMATLVIMHPTFVDRPTLRAIQGEVAAHLEAFAQHYSNYNKRRSWTALALRGYSDDPGFIIKPAEMARAWKRDHPEYAMARPRWTPLAEAVPHTMATVGQLVVGLLGGTMDAVDRVRFMRLRAGEGELTRHADITDRDAGVRDGSIARVHIPIVTSVLVQFTAWDARGRRHDHSFEPGAAFYLDQRKPHAVRNDDPSVDRIHLVVDVAAGPGLRAAVAKAHTEHEAWVP